MKLRTLESFQMINEARDLLKSSMPKEIFDINRIFKKHGHELYIVGGAVRDTLMGQSPKDFDLATDASPDKVEQMMMGKFQTEPVGKAFGVMLIVGKQEEYEVATFREDLSAGRRPDGVKFSTIDKDVLRRDLTINALFYDIDKGEVVDLVGGVLDLEQKNIKTVGSAEERFEEDALRKLRAIRFAGRLNGKLDPEIIKALKRDASLPQVSPERIRAEFESGIKKSKSSRTYLKLLEEFGFLELIFPKLIINKNFVESNNFEVQLATILKDNDISKHRKYLTEVLKYTTDEVKAIEALNGMINPNIEKDLLILLRRVKDSKISMKTASEFAKINNLNRKQVKGLMAHKVTTKGNSPEMKGLKGQEIGNAILRIEAEKFRKQYA